MDIAVVYESLYGNTRLVAEAVAAGIREGDPTADVTLVRADEAELSQMRGADLIVVGAPTHALRMSTPETRHNAPGLEAGQEDRPGVREWLDSLPRASHGARGAAFDTRVASPFSGGAARSIARAMRQRGYALASDPQGFIVSGSRGPLKAGQVSAAREWGAALVGRGGAGARWPAA